MGLFSDKCTALISLETHRHLTGDELAAAQQALRDEPGLLRSRDSVLAAHGWGICGHDVKKKARFCSKCGAPAPKGWVKCPSCGKWVGNESTHCWNCNHALHPESRTNLEGGVWNRAEGLFAERFEVGEVENMLKNGIQVQEGTAAILLDAGKQSAVLGPGRHNPDSALRAINWFGNPPPRSVVLVDAGEFVVPLRMGEGLRTADGFPVSVYAELTLRFVRGRADDFLANFVKDARSVAYAEMSESLAGVLAYGIRNLCETSTVEDLVKDPERREQFEAAIRKAADETLKAWGFEVVRVAAADFSSPEYEKIRMRNAAFDEKRREVEFLRRTREVLAQDAARDREMSAAERETADGGKMDQAKAERDLAEYMAQLAQEKGISAAERDAELKLLLMAKRNEVSVKEAEYVLARKIADRAAAMENEIREAEFRAQRDVFDADHRIEMDVKRQGAAMDAETRKTDHDLAIKEKLRSYTVDSMLRNEMGQEELLKIQAREEEIRSRIETSKIDLEAYRTRTSATAEADANAYRTRTEGIAQTDVEADRILRVGKATNEVRSGEVDNDLKRLKGLRDIDRDIDETKIRASVA